MKNYLENKSVAEVVQILEDYYKAEARDVINSVSHDIKNPLGIIDLSLGLLEDKLGPLLEKIEPELAAKITKFIGNINHGIERCQVILDNTLLLRGSENEVVDTVIFKTFFENFSIFAKPSFKRSKISVTNEIDETIEVRANIQIAAQALVAFLKIATEPIIPNQSHSMTVHFGDNKLFLTIKTLDDQNIYMNTEESESFQFLKFKALSLFTTLNTTYKIEQVSATTIQAEFQWPKF